MDRSKVTEICMKKYYFLSYRTETKDNKFREGSRLWQVNFWKNPATIYIKMVEDIKKDIGIDEFIITNFYRVY